MEKLTAQLKQTESVLITSHCRPDGDAVGSLIALGLCLKALKKDIALYNESAIPTVYRFLSSVDLITNQMPEHMHFDTVVILDCAELTRVGAAASKIGEIPVIINIDHHLTNSRFGHFNRVDENACATAEIVYYLIKELEVPITVEMAAAIYTGIFTDTGSFRFSNTNRSAFKICDEMVQIGVDPYTVAQHVYGAYSLGRLKLLNLALDSIEISGNGKLSLMTLTQDMMNETGTQPEDVDGLIHYARRIQHVKVAVLIREYVNGHAHHQAGQQYHVSLRSDGTVDVSKIAARFGGGGHSAAAGFNIDAAMDDLKNGMFHLAEEI